MSKARQLAELGNVYDDGALSNRNLIINGAMQVAQRGTSATGVTTSGYYACDRARSGFTSLGTWTISQETDAPDGFSNSYKVLCTVADASPAANDLVTGYEIRLEGQDLQHLKYGTNDARTMTLSFWVKSNKTGNASFQCMQLDNNNKSASFQYTINSANTWEYKTIVIPADTSGLFNNDNGIAFYGAFWINSGSTYTGGSHQTTWADLDQSSRNASNLGVGGAINDYWQITGIQLEVGDTATPFEHRSYGQELALCQRYYQRSNQDLGSVFSYGDGDIASARCVNSNWLMDNVGFKAIMRANPTFRNSDNAGTVGKVMRSANSTSLTLSLTCRLDGEVRAFPGGSVNTYESVQFSWDADAEL